MVVREGLDEKVIFQQRPEEAEGVTHSTIWAGKENRQRKRKCKDLRQEEA